MFEKFTAEDAGDFRTRYLNTYGFFRKGTRKTLVKLVDITADGNQKAVHFVDAAGVQYLLNADSPDESIGFEFLPPKMSYHNLETGVVVLLKRSPHRQFLRGICDKNITINGENMGGMRVDFANLDAIFNRSLTPAQMFRKVLTGETLGAIAISPQFAINFPKNVIYCYGKPIGKASIQTKSAVEALVKVTLDDVDMWRTEISDACARENIPVEVK